MKILSYVSSLLPSFKKDRIVEDCRLTKLEIRESTLPAYETALELFKSFKWKSQTVKDMFAQFSRIVKVSGGASNPLVTIEKVLRATLENIDLFEDMVNRTYNEEVAGLGMTYLKANLLQLIEYSAFFSKYARKFLHYVQVLEALEQRPEPSVLDEDPKLSDTFSPFEIDWIKQNFIPFCSVINILSGTPDTIRKSLSEISPIVITNENAGTLGETIGNNKIDPFNLGIIPVWANPIYHIGLAVAEWQGERYKAAVAERDVIQLRKLHLQQLAQGKPDARAEKLIFSMESRISDMNYKIAEMERKYG